MNRATEAAEIKGWPLEFLKGGVFLPACVAGLLIPLGFSPFHYPGLAILGLALFFGLLRQQSLKQSFLIGFLFGLSFLGLGVSWVYVSIHEYGNLSFLGSALITLCFILYLALYPAFVASFYQLLSQKCSLLFSCIVFSATWCLGEYFRSTFMGGFPWLQIGFAQMDTPLKYLLPIFGVYGVSFITALAASFLTLGVNAALHKRYVWIIAFTLILLSPLILQNKIWGIKEDHPIPVGIVQANLSMRDKWDESLFWQLLEHYKHAVESLIFKSKLIVLPESAIPLPSSYVGEFLSALSKQAKESNAAVLLGIPEPTADDTQYYNALISLGLAEGFYLKQHLVPFGEFIPKPFQKFIDWLELPSSNMEPGRKNQNLVQVNHRPIATLICYELAYPTLLRQQLPAAEWIVSISDDGWFGHSFAMHQQLQMAQVLALLTARFHVVANNDGLSSVIDSNGSIMASLPAFEAGTLEAKIYPVTGVTPWVLWGDTPILLLCFIIVIIAIFRTFLKRFNQRSYCCEAQEALS